MAEEEGREITGIGTVRSVLFSALTLPSSVGRRRPKMEKITLSRVR